MWPFVVKDTATRNSKYRTKGTPVLKPINVDKDVYEDYVLNKVFPAIKEKCPASMKSKTIRLQQDNAQHHTLINNNSEKMAEKLEELNLDIEIKPQPAQSPDLYILDLSIFRAIQSLKYKKGSKNLEELIKHTLEAFNAYEP